MIYVCPECGDNCTLSSGSEHGFFGTCNACEVGQMELDPVAVAPASEVERLREALKRERERYGPSGVKFLEWLLAEARWERDYLAEALGRARR